MVKPSYEVCLFFQNDEKREPKRLYSRLDDSLDGGSPLGKELISIIFSLLIITIPVVTANELHILNISGTDGVRNYFKSNDQLNVVVQAGIDTDQLIDRTQLALYLGTTFFGTFDTCTVIDNTTQCILQKSAPQVRQYSAEVRLFDDTGKMSRQNPILRLQEPLIGDNLPAYVSEPNIGIVTRGAVHIEGAAEDRALSEIDATRCSGVKEILITVDHSTNPAKRIIGNTKCFQPISEDISIGNATDGDHIITLLAKDRFNQGQPIELPVVLDTTTPRVDTQGIRILDHETQSNISFLSSHASRIVDITIPIQDQTLDTHSIKADFTTLSGIPTGMIEPTKFEDGSAIWERIPIPSFQSCSIGILARDAAGNQLNTSLACTIQRDDTPPEPIALVTSGIDGDKPLIGISGELRIRFNEAGIGMKQGNAYLDLGNVIGVNNVKAERCEAETTGGFVCLWRYKGVRGQGEKKIRVNTNTKDDLGNTIATAKQFIVVLDTSGPQITKFEYGIFSSTQSQSSIAVKGSRILFTLNGTGFDSSRAFLDVHELGGSGTINMICTGSSCSAEQQVSRDGFTEAIVRVNVSDLAGNVAISSTKVIIASIDSGPSEYWSSNVRCSPSVLDRSLGPLIEQRVYCDIGLTSNNPSAVPMVTVFAGASSCSGDTNYFTKLDTLNFIPASVHPTFIVQLQATEFKVNELHLNCPLQITTVLNQSGRLSVNPNPQTLNVNITIPFFNLPMGDIFANMDKEIDKEVNDAKNSLSIVGKLNTFLKYAEKACNAYQIFQSLSSSFTALTYLFGKQAQVAVAVPAAHESFVKMRNDLCDINDQRGKQEDGTGKGDGLMGFFQKMCAFVNCRLTSDPESSDAGMLEKIGGGSPFCQDIKNKLASIGGAEGVRVPSITNDRYTYLGGNPASIDVKNSLIMSTMCMCVPGIIHNVEKYREIKCRHAICLLDEVKQKGVPRQFCDEVKSVETCEFIVGDIFNLFPIVTLFSTVLGIIKEVFANPIQLISVYSGLKCQGFCKDPVPEKYAGCVTPKILAKLGDAINNIRQAKNILNSFEVGGDACDRLEKMTEKK